MAKGEFQAIHQRDLFNFQNGTILELFDRVTKTAGIVLYADATRKVLARRDDRYADRQNYPELLDSGDVEAGVVPFPEYPHGFRTNENTWNTNGGYPVIEMTPTIIEKQTGFDITITSLGDVVPNRTTIFADGSAIYNNGYPLTAAGENYIAGLSLQLDHARERIKKLHLFPWLREHTKIAKRTNKSLAFGVAETMSKANQQITESVTTGTINDKRDNMLIRVYGNDPLEASGRQVWGLWWQHYRPEQLHLYQGKR